MLKYQWLNDFDRDMVHLCKEHHIFNQRMANLQLMKAPEQTLCFARCDLFFVFNFHATNSLEHVLIPVYPDSKEFTVAMTSDDYRYGGFGAVAHQVYPVKEFDGQRYVELYIPARTAIVLQETKEPPKPKRKPSAKKAAPKTARKTKKAE
jgi:1,4-alpha-glucan branching enzyme